MLKIITIIGFFLLSTLPALAAGTVYSTVLDDLPLMQGMSERPDDTVVFDNPNGRIVEFSTQTTASAAAVKDFYTHILTPLGWRAVDATHFIRDKEKLKLDFEKKGDETIVHFAVTPVEGK
jgi:hypothetical protein